MNTFCVSLQKKQNVDAAWQLFENTGCIVLFSSMDETKSELVIQSKQTKNELLKNFSCIQECEEMNLNEVDYASEWERHSPYFIEGKVHLPLLSGKEVILNPGAGFGDLSHPTTHLVLDLMVDYISAQTVVDIGSGSGVLSFAAAGLGAKEVIGIDIDKKAVLHAKENALLNPFDAKVQFFTPDEFRDYPLNGSICILMNMILVEQKVAFSAFSKNRKTSGVLIASGILEEQQKEYEEVAKEFNWTIEKIKAQEGWLGIIAKF